LNPLNIPIEYRLCHLTSMGWIKYGTRKALYYFKHVPKIADYSVFTILVNVGHNCKNCSFSFHEILVYKNDYHQGFFW